VSSDDRSRKGRSPTVKAAADRAEARARGEPITEPKVPIDPPTTRTVVPEPAAPTRLTLDDLPPPPDAPAIIIGKPTKYDPEWMLAKVIELGRYGKSKAQIARALGISASTLRTWTETHPAFCEAIDTARTLSLAWWEDAGQLGVFVPAKDFNVNAWHAQVKARFADEYRDVTAHELTGRDGKPIGIEDRGTIDDARRVAFALQMALRRMDARQSAETVEPVSGDSKVVAISRRPIGAG